MPTVYLTQKGMLATVTGERIELANLVPDRAPMPDRRWIPLFDVEHIVLDSMVRMSPQSIARLLRRKIPILFLGHGNFPAGMALPMNLPVGSLVGQVDRSRDGSFRLSQSCLLINAKIRNMKRVLQKLHNRKGTDSGTVMFLKAMANQASAAGSTDALRGIEGAATGRYFEALNDCFPPEMPFQRRSRRPPHNAVNALLSFVYTLLVSEISMHLHGVGLHPGIGVFHENEDNRPSLSLDLVEPFRAPIADALAVDLINHRRLENDDFEPRDNGILLKRNSRRTVYAAFENRLEREFFYPPLDHRTTFRSIIKAHCVDIKYAFREERPWKPFIMP